jgi:hypothetical protein
MYLNSQLNCYYDVHGDGFIPLRLCYPFIRNDVKMELEI